MAFVYILQSGDENLFKIGRTKGEVKKRIKQLATGNPRPLIMIEVIETDYDTEYETYLHHRLRPKRITDGDAREFFAIEIGELKGVLDDARRFVEEYVRKKEEAEKLLEVECDERVLRPGDHEWEIYRNLVEARHRQDEAELDRRSFEYDLKLRIGTAAGLDRIATWKGSVSTVFDRGRFKAEEPDLYEQFLVRRRTRSFRLA